MRRRYRVVVVGLGIMGSASLWRLSTSCKEILGVESGAPINLLGSSYGGSRIFRKAYWEGEAYLPLLDLSDALWGELNRSCNAPIIFPTGGLFIGSADSGVVRKSAATAKTGKVRHSSLSASQVAQCFPAFHVSSGMEAVYEHGAYTIAANKSKLHMIDLAKGNGAETLFGVEVVSIKLGDGSLDVELDSGEVVAADKVVLATGSRLGVSLISDLAGLLQPKSVPVYWFRSRSDGLGVCPTSLPAFLYKLSDGRLLYGTPEIDMSEPGVKIGFHNFQQTTLDMQTQRTAVNDLCVEEISSCVEKIIPGLNSRPYAARKCIYTMTADESFIVGESRELPGVFYISACSGHGFKFAPGIGEVIARAVLDGETEYFDLFSKSRFNSK
jgi:sarcosine oxidase